MLQQNVATFARDSRHSSNWLQISKHPVGQNVIVKRTSQSHTDKSPTTHGSQCTTIYIIAFFLSRCRMRHNSIRLAPFFLSTGSISSRLAADFELVDRIARGERFRSQRLTLVVLLDVDRGPARRFLETVRHCAKAKEEFIIPLTVGIIIEGRYAYFSTIGNCSIGSGSRGYWLTRNPPPLLRRRPTIVSEICQDWSVGQYRS